MKDNDPADHDSPMKSRDSRGRPVVRTVHEILEIMAERIPMAQAIDRLVNLVGTRKLIVFAQETKDAAEVPGQTTWILGSRDFHLAGSLWLPFEPNRDAFYLADRAGLIPEPEEPPAVETLVVFIDEDFPRTVGGVTDGAPDMAAAEKYVAERSVGETKVVLVADGYPGLRDEELLALVKAKGWHTRFISTTRSERFSPYDAVISFLLKQFNPRDFFAYQSERASDV